MYKELELLAPAKNREIGIAAINCGADAVYIAAESFGARESAANPMTEIKLLVDYAHLYGVKIFIVVNTILYDNEIEKAVKLIWDAYKVGVDAIIVQDLGLLLNDLPPIPLYASTQTDIRNVEKAKLLENLGFSRLILARELSLDNIKEISDNTDTPLESFVHGALCVSYSGQCYLSRQITGRSANRGECSQACRSNYDLVDTDGNIIVKNSHLLSLKDLNLSSKIPDLVNAGISSFKIEGRLKNESFVKNTVLLYRTKIDEALKQQIAKDYTRASFGDIKTSLISNPDVTFNRGFTTFFLEGKRDNWKSADGAKHLGEFIGNVTTSKFNKQGFLEFKYNYALGKKSKIVNGDGLCFINQKGEVTGLRANSCDPSTLTVTTTEKCSIAQGTKIYRNYNFSFEKELSQKTQKRIIPLDLTLVIDSPTPYFTIECKKSEFTNPVFSFKYPITIEGEKANNSDTATKNIINQFSKTSEHFSFNLKKIENPNNLDIPFYPLSALNSLRREIAQTTAKEIEKHIKLEKKIEEEKEKIRREKCKNFILKHTKIFTNNTSTYLLNASNKYSKKLYKDLGISYNPTSYELEPTEKAILMRTKYCIKFQLGLCPKTTSKRVKEPLYIVNNKNKFQLQFDCAKCEMMVIG